MTLRMSAAILIGMVVMPVSGFTDDAPAPPVPAPQFHYFMRIPHSALSCAQEAQALAGRFAKATSLTVLQANCVGSPVLKADGKSYVLDSLDLVYSADAEVTPYTATVGGTMYPQFPSNFTGAYYSTFAACVADLGAQSALYESATGLAAVAASCAPEPMGNGAQYSLSIDGFGQPTEELQAFQLELDGTPVAAFRKASLDLIVRSGGQIARIADGGVLYYAVPTNPAVSHLSIAIFDSVQQCGAEMVEARKIFAGASALPVVVACLPTINDLGGQALEVVYIGNAVVNNDFGMQAPKYYSYAECAADRARELQAIQAQEGIVLGGICDADDLAGSGEWVLDVFSKDP
jgi:hypothetical protein